VKFIHAADIHLDSPLAGLSRRGAIPAHVTKDCTRRAFANLIDLAIAEDVAFLLIAGDLYDGEWRDFSTGLFFAAEMRRLGRPCILIRGNHDAASVITRALEPPPNVTVFSARRPETVRLEGLGVALHGQSFPNRAVPEDLSAGYPGPIAGMLNIGLLHTSANDPGEHETYAPCAPDSLALKGYDYWALGHIHIRATLHERPWIVFPGNIQGRNPRETGAKGCVLVETREGRIVSTEFRALDVLRWHRAAIDVSGAEAFAEIAARIRFGLAALAAEGEGRPLIARLSLTGATRLHTALLADPDRIEAECRAAAAAISGDLHIERVRIETAEPASSPGSVEEADHLRGTFLAALDDPDIQARLIDLFRDLAKELPRQPGRPAPALPTSAEDLRALAADAWSLVAHGLAEGAP
jgi:DNA repair exonuclease SbcCD nuclease subunit